MSNPGVSTIRHLERAEWRQLARSFADFNYRQTWAYAQRMSQESNSTCEHVAVTSTDGGVLGLASVRVKTLPVVGSGLAYISGGPLVGRGGSESVARLQAVLAGLIEEYCQGRRLTLRVLPPTGPVDWNSQAAKVFEHLGFQQAAQPSPYRTLVVDLQRPLAEIRAGLHQKWRNCLNAAQRKDTAVVHGHGAAEFDQLQSLLSDLIEHKGFKIGLDADFYKSVQADAAPEDRLVVILAQSGGKTVAAQLSSMHGDSAIYVLGASSDAARKVKASYLLQWRTIEIAHERGLAYYDLGGIDPDGNPGVYHFKKGMCGEDVTAAGPYELRPPGVRSWLTRVAEAGVRAARRRRGS